jgi:mannosyltransferase OCH1-like enzyme
MSHQNQNIWILLLVIIFIVLIYYFNSKSPESTESYLNINKPESYPNANLLPIVMPTKIYLCYNTTDIPTNIIPMWTKLNPGYEIHLYDNDDCKKFLYEYYGTEFVEIYSSIEDDSIKEDFWRLCILYKNGGASANITTRPSTSIDTVIDPTVSFLTCISDNNDNTNNNYNIIYDPSIIISVPYHHVLRICIDIYVEFYRTNIKYNNKMWSLQNILSYTINNMFSSSIKDVGIYADSNLNMYQFIKKNKLSLK